MRSNHDRIARNVPPRSARRKMPDAKAKTIAAVVVVVVSARVEAMSAAMNVQKKVMPVQSMRRMLHFIL